MRLTALFVAQALLASLAMAQDATHVLDSALTATVREGAPGAVVIVLKDGEVVYRRSRGIANLATGKPLGPDTPIYIASIAKQFTAMAIMRLAERGQLRYDDTIDRYVPEIREFAGAVTLRQMLTHTSGLPDHLDVMKDSVPGWTNADVLGFLRRYGRLDSAPSAASSYSNSAYVLLAMVVERVTGGTFPAFIATEFLRPLGMASTGIITPSASPPAGMARGYDQDGDAWRPAGYDAFTYGAGGMYSTANDLAKWISAVADGRVVADSTLRMASTAVTTSTGKPTPWGFGWLAEFDARGPLANVWYVASIGSFKGYQGLVKYIPDQGFTIIVLTNSGRLPFPLVNLAHRLYAQ